MTDLMCFRIACKIMREPIRMHCWLVQLVIHCSVWGILIRCHAVQFNAIHSGIVQQSAM